MVGRRSSCCRCCSHRKIANRRWCFRIEWWWNIWCHKGFRRWIASRNGPSRRRGRRKTFWRKRERGRRRRRGQNSSSWVDSIKSIFLFIKSSFALQLQAMVAKPTNSFGHKHLQTSVSMFHYHQAQSLRCWLWTSRIHAWRCDEWTFCDVFAQTVHCWWRVV